MSFDQKLKALRLENKMTQEYVARKLNVARSTIAGYETKAVSLHMRSWHLWQIFFMSVSIIFWTVRPGRKLWS